MFVLVIVVLVLVFAVGVALVASAAIEPRVRRSENLAQIDVYGYAGRDVLPTTRGASRPSRPARESIDRVASSLGAFVSTRLLNVREDEVQKELVSAGFYNVAARRFIGYRALAAIVLPIGLVWLFAAGGASIPILLMLGILGFALGWVGPNIVLHRRAAQRLENIDLALPGLIDLLVVTLEAGVAFTGALRLAAERLEGPLGDEIRLTIQEQSLGLSTLEALENWLRRCDTPSVRAFVRAMVQGDKLGVSIGMILRNQAVEIRARQRHMVEEKAQKAPIKILFPLVFLIFPAMFIIILAPAMFQIVKTLHT
jgi:tight adherence protein C